MNDNVLEVKRIKIPTMDAGLATEVTGYEIYTHLYEPAKPHGGKRVKLATITMGRPPMVEIYDIESEGKYLVPQKSSKFYKLIAELADYFGDPDYYG